MAAEVVRSSSFLFFFVVLVLITKFTQGRLLNMMEKVSHIEGGSSRMMHDISDSSTTTIVEKTKVVGHETTLLDAAGKYYLDSTQQGHSPGVGHPFVSSKDAQEMEEQTNVAAGKTHDYSPGVGHSVPSTDGLYGAKSEAAGGGGAPVLADKRNAKGKSDDYSPGVGHSSPGSDNKRATGGVAMQNNKYNDVQYERTSDNENLVIDRHSPGVGHSIQEKHAEPKARK